jgi:hypothetical protein
MTPDREWAKAKAGVFRSAQDDGVKQTTARTTADPYGMTNKRAGNDKCSGNCNGNDKYQRRLQRQLQGERQIPAATATANAAQRQMQRSLEMVGS